MSHTQTHFLSGYNIVAIQPLQLSSSGFLAVPLQRSGHYSPGPQRSLVLAIYLVSQKLNFYWCKWLAPFFFVQTQLLSQIGNKILEDGLQHLYLDACTLSLQSAISICRNLLFFSSKYMVNTAKFFVEFTRHQIQLSGKRHIGNRRRKNEWHKIFTKLYLPAKNYSCLATTYNADLPAAFCIMTFVPVITLLWKVKKMAENGKNIFTEIGPLGA